MVTKKPLSPVPLVLSIDGIDGCGKTTLIQELKKRFERRLTMQDRPYRVAITSFFGTTAEAIAFRKRLVSGQIPLQEAFISLLHYTNKSIREDIYQLRQSHDVVLVDRSRASLFAYQIMQYHGQFDPVYRDIALRNMAEDRELGHNLDYLYIRITPEESMRRIAKRVDKQDAFDLQSREFFERCYSGYEQYWERTASLYHQRAMIIDIDQLKSIGIALHSQVADTVYNMLIERYTDNLISIDLNG